MKRRTSAATKLAGWSILAGVAVVIIGIYLVSRLAAPAVPPPAGAASASASAPPGLSEAPSSAQTETTASDAVPSSAPASSPTASSEAPPSSAAASSSAVVVIEPDSMDQGARKALLNTLINQGVFTGVQAVGSPPKVGVTPLFQGLNANLQSQFIAAVYAYVNNGAAGNVPLQLIDATTGKTIGSYTTASGLTLL